MDQVRKLHVWEHPDLHRSDPTPPLGNLPVHLIYEPDEFDWWMVDDHGDLHIGRWEKVESAELETGYYMAQVTQVVVPRGMYAKVNEEIVAHTPPVIKSDVTGLPATVPVVPVERPAVAPHDIDATVTLPRVSTGTTGEADSTVPFAQISGYQQIGGGNPLELTLPLRIPLP